ncbi:alpha/beta hydrolase [Candidatus Mycobacterium wuenschmannii]|uniref:Alpha/beta hydrolase n=2 Tax=Candidatus Mycobacterium wuenschmannii TaxID=3027808 RepID=A0ABY8W719_9MYCO|nr:alpha/beta hydrolase [Candidatus Mycobacterium wuenschmannii]WIM90247.1 alpha/beta hydrolase [Candidatus Mycobacterium wuenschmannii]
MVRHGLHLASGPIGAYRTGSLLLRGSPTVAGFLAGWLTSEFPPQVLTGHALSGVAPLSKVATGWAAQRSDRILTAALDEALGEHYRDSVHHPIDDRPERRGGVLHSAGGHRRYAAETSDIVYGPNVRDNMLDIWRHRDIKPGHKAPVLLQIPGGAWTVNGRRPQGYPLMGRMAELGWVCVSIDYCKSPRNAWPGHIVDVKRALAWVRENIADYGGDPDFIAVTGGSAGGHLAALVALTANDPSLQPGFEDADTTVQAAAPYYGVYDLTDTAKMHDMMMQFLELFVMKEQYADNPGLFELASPISHVHRDAPPFFVLHGESDSVIPSVQARSFCDALRDAGAATVGYAELPNAHHAFDLFATVRSRLAADAVADFLGAVHGRHQRSGTRSMRKRVASTG